MPTDTTNTESVERNKALNAARSAAVSTLIENHKSEFNDLYKAEAAERGYEWSPRLTAEEKAAKDLADLLAKYPHLADKVNPAGDVTAADLGEDPSAS